MSAKKRKACSMMKKDRNGMHTFQDVVVQELLFLASTGNQVFELALQLLLLQLILSCNQLGSG
jgi:hypothetical protein